MYEGICIRAYWVERDRNGFSDVKKTTKTTPVKVISIFKPHFWAVQVQGTTRPSSAMLPTLAPAYRVASTANQLHQNNTSILFHRKPVVCSLQSQQHIGAKQSTMGQRWNRQNMHKLGPSNAILNKFPTTAILSPGISNGKRQTRSNVFQAIHTQTHRSNH